VEPIADHQPTTVLVELVGMRLDVGSNLSLERGRQHRPRAVADDLIKQRPTRLDGLAVVGLPVLVDYLEHGRTFPNQRANAGPDHSCLDSDHPREGAPHHVTRPRAIGGVATLCRGRSTHVRSRHTRYGA
jgi:hypothetical protein